MGLSTDDAGDDSTDADAQYSSNLEKFMATRFAPKLLTRAGRITVLIVYIIFALIALYACLHVETNFTMEYFIPEGSYTWGYF